MTAQEQQTTVQPKVRGGPCSHCRSMMKAGNNFCSNCGRAALKVTDAISLKSDDEGLAGAGRMQASAFGQNKQAAILEQTLMPGSQGSELLPLLPPRQFVPFDIASQCVATAGGSTRSWSVASLPNDDYFSADAIELDDLRQIGPSAAEHSRELVASSAPGSDPFERTGPSPLDRGSADLLQYTPSLPSTSGTPWPRSSSTIPTNTATGRLSSMSPWPASASLPSTPWPTAGRDGRSPSMWPLSSPSPNGAHGLPYSPTPEDAEMVRLMNSRAAAGSVPPLSRPEALWEHYAETLYAEAMQRPPSQKEIRQLSTGELCLSNEHLRHDIHCLKAQIDRRRSEFNVWLATSEACRDESDDPLPSQLQTQPLEASVPSHD